MLRSIPGGFKSPSLDFFTALPLDFFFFSSSTTSVASTADSIFSLAAGIAAELFDMKFHRVGAWKGVRSLERAEKRLRHINRPIKRVQRNIVFLSNYLKYLPWSHHIEPAVLFLRASVAESEIICQVVESWINIS